MPDFGFFAEVWSTLELETALDSHELRLNILLPGHEARNALGIKEGDVNQVYWAQTRKSRNGRRWNLPC